VASWALEPEVVTTSDMDDDLTLLYVASVLDERAGALLRSGMPAVQVAAQVGFADQSHFSRHFKRIYRTTPTGYTRGAPCVPQGDLPRGGARA
jgi:AraC-like DNA-binding protein